MSACAVVLCAVGLLFGILNAWKHILPLTARPKDVPLTLSLLLSTIWVKVDKMLAATIMNLFSVCIPSAADWHIGCP